MFTIQFKFANVKLVMYVFTKYQSWWRSTLLYQNNGSDTEELYKRISRHVCVRDTSHVFVNILTQKGAGETERGACLLELDVGENTK